MELLDAAQEISNSALVHGVLGKGMVGLQTYRPRLQRPAITNRACGRDSHEIPNTPQTSFLDGKFG